MKGERRSFGSRQRSVLSFSEHDNGSLCSIEAGT